MPVYLDGKEYANDAEVEAHFNPAIPASLASAFTMPLEGSTKPAGALKSEEATGVAPLVEASPEPSQEVDWSKLNQPFGSVKSTSKEDTPVVATAAGGITITEGDIGQALNVGMGAGPGIMTGVKAAKSLNSLNNLGHAQLLESKGLSSDEILQQTGWSKGAEGRWKFEIDDSVSKLDTDWVNRPPVKTPEPKDPFEQTPWNPYEGQVAARLDSVLDHPELYKAYPSLKDVTVVYNPELKNAGGYADFAGHTIVIGKELAQNKGTFLHEIQHFIQNFEGFAQGAAPLKTPSQYRLRYQKDMDALVPEMRELYTKWEKGDTITKEEINRLVYLQEVATKYNQYVKAADEEAMDLYMRMAGEVEARNVEIRELLDPTTRRYYSPAQGEKDMGYPRERQIVVEKPVGTTAYGYVDPATGKRVKPK